MRFQEWGKNVIGWGTQAPQATERFSTLTLQELQAAGVTEAQLRGALDFYSQAFAQNPGNAAAAERAKLMLQGLHLLGK
jgi:hypothetical protein